MSIDETLALADGRVFTGRQAVSNNLIDGLGGEKEALLWLAAEDPSLAGLPIIDHYPQEGFPLEGFSSALAYFFGAPAVSVNGLAALRQPGS